MKNTVNRKVKLYRVFTAFFLCAVMAVFSSRGCYASNPPAEMSLSVQQTTEGLTNQQNASFDYVLEALDPQFPMPAGADGYQYFFTISGNQTVELEPISFLHGGVYTYQVYQVNQNRQGYVYDHKVYTISVYAKNKSDGTLVLELVADNGNGQKPADIVFRNAYTGTNGALITTGDPAFMLVWLFVLIASLLGLIVLRGVRKRTICYPAEK